MDITYCVNNSCELKYKCQRHRINNDESNYTYWISYAYFEPKSKESCDYFFSTDESDDEEYQLNKNLPC